MSSIPKGENIPAHQPYLNSIAEELNERPQPSWAAPHPRNPSNDSSSPTPMRCYDA